MSFVLADFQAGNGLSMADSINVIQDDAAPTSQKSSVLINVGLIQQAFNLDHGSACEFAQDVLQKLETILDSLD